MYKRSLYLDGPRILPTALLDIYETKEKPRIEIEQSEENLECKNEFDVH